MPLRVTGSWSLRYTMLEYIWGVFSSALKPEDRQGGGLASVRRIIDRHQGNIEIESTPGQGSTFLVYFPRAIIVEEEDGEEGWVEGIEAVLFPIGYIGFVHVHWVSRISTGLRLLGIVWRSCRRSRCVSWNFFGTPRMWALISCQAARPSALNVVVYGRGKSAIGTVVKISR